MSARPEVAPLRRRLFALFADAVTAIARGDPVDGAEVRGRADEILDEAFAEAAQDLIREIRHD